MNRTAVAKELIAVARTLMAADEISVGDKVAYARKFLMSIGDHTMGRLIGTVTKLEPMGSVTLATIKWNGDAPERVNTKNLVLKSKMHLEPV